MAVRSRPYSGNYDFYEQQRALGEAQRQAQFERQQAMLAKEIKFIERFKARASHAAQVQSRVKKLDKIERVEPPRRRQSVQFEFRTPPRSGDDVASFRDVHKGYGSRKIYAGLDFRVRRKERWCVLGANGAGKSTLLKLVAGATGPDQGSVTVGSNVRMGYFAQHSMDLLDGDDTVFESLDESFPQAGQGALRALAGCFGFSGDDVEKPCRVLSGGEKARLVMARCCSIRRTSWFSTNRRTIWTWRRRRCWSPRCRNSRAPCCSSRMTATSLARSRTACWN